MTDRSLGPAGRPRLDTDRLRLTHQPIVDLRTGRSAGAEALLRLDDPAGAQRPGRFLATLADPDILVELAGWVLDRVVAQLLVWDDAGIGPASMWLNLSGPELGTDAILDRVDGALAASGIEPHRINLEVPEPRLVGAPPAWIRRLRHLAAVGVRLGIDDVGTAPTPVDELGSLPLSFLKIDPSIGRRVLEPGGPALVEAVVAIGRALDFDLIAEGVEGRAQLEALARLGCTHAQGDVIAVAADAGHVRFGDSLLGAV